MKTGAVRKGEQSALAAGDVTLLAAKAGETKLKLILRAAARKTLWDLKLSVIITQVLK
jgi:hypothetical protein